MIRTFIELSTSHLDEAETPTISALISELGHWPDAFENAEGYFIPVTCVKGDLTPPMLQGLLKLASEFYPNVPYVLFHPAADVHPVFPTFEWHSTPTETLAG